MGSDLSSGPSCVFLLSENRAPRVSMRTLADVIFPEVISFPLRQRLTLNGAFEDTILSAFHVTDEKEELGVIVGPGTEEDDL